MPGGMGGAWGSIGLGFALPGDLVELIAGMTRAHASGDAVTLAVARDGELVELDTTLATREDVRP